MNPNCHTVHPCTVGAQFRTNRTYKLFSASTSMHVHRKLAVITMPLRTENQGAQRTWKTWKTPGKHLEFDSWTGKKMKVNFNALLPRCRVLSFIINYD